MTKQPKNSFNLDDSIDDTHFNLQNSSSDESHDSPEMLAQILDSSKILDRTPIIGGSSVHESEEELARWLDFKQCRSFANSGAIISWQ